MAFPRRVYTQDEVRRAKSLIDGGYRHRLRIIGSPEFKSKVKDALSLIKEAGRYDFLRRNIRAIVEIEGLSQLREAEASIWMNRYAVEDPFEAAGFIIQKAWQMDAYLRGVLYYGHVGETAAVSVRISFLRELKAKSRDPKVREECERRLRLWEESKLL